MPTRAALAAGFQLLVACGFNFEAVATEMSKLGPLRSQKARMNAALHMANDRKNSGKVNPFFGFGEPDIELLHARLEHGTDSNGPIFSVPHASFLDAGGRIAVRAINHLGDEVMKVFRV